MRWSAYAFGLFGGELHELGQSKRSFEPLEQAFTTSVTGAVRAKSYGKERQAKRGGGR